MGGDRGDARQPSVVAVGYIAADPLRGSRGGDDGRRGARGHRRVRRRRA